MPVVTCQWFVATGGGYGNDRIYDLCGPASGHDEFGNPYYSDPAFRKCFCDDPVKGSAAVQASAWFATLVHSGGGPLQDGVGSSAFPVPSFNQSLADFCIEEACDETLLETHCYCLYSYTDPGTCVEYIQATSDEAWQAALESVGILAKKVDDSLCGTPFKWYCIYCPADSSLGCTFFCGTLQGAQVFLNSNNITGGKFDPAKCPGGWQIRPVTPEEAAQNHLGDCEQSPDYTSVIQICKEGGKIKVKLGGKICKCGGGSAHGKGTDHIPGTPSGVGMSLSYACAVCGGSVHNVPRYLDIEIPGDFAKGPSSDYCTNCVWYLSQAGAGLIAEFNNDDCSSIAGSYRAYWAGFYVDPSQWDYWGCCYYYDFPGHNTFGSTALPQGSGPDKLCYARSDTMWRGVSACLGGVSALGGGQVLLVNVGASCCWHYNYGCIYAGFACSWAAWVPGSTYAPNEALWLKGGNPDHTIDCTPGKSYQVPFWKTGSESHGNDICLFNGQSGDATSDPTLAGLPAATITIGPQ